MSFALRPICDLCKSSAWPRCAAVVLLVCVGSMLIGAAPWQSGSDRRASPGDLGALRRNAAAFNDAAARIPEGEHWASEFLQLAGDDDAVLKLFSKPKLPVLPNTWAKMTTLQRTDWLRENNGKVEPLLLRVRTPQGARRWVYLFRVEVGGMEVRDIKEDRLGIRVEANPKPPAPPPGKPRDAKSRERQITPRYDLLISAEDSEHPIVKRRRGDALPSTSFFIPIVFAGDGVPSLRPENYRPEFVQGLQEYGYNAGRLAIPGLGQWNAGGQMLPAVSTMRTLLVALEHKLAPKP